VKNSKQKAHKPNKKTPAPPPRSKITAIAVRPKPFLTCAKWLGSAALSLIAVAGAYFQFQPTVSVNPDASLNPKDALSTPFSICNESVFSIYNVSNNYTINHIEAEHGLSVFGGTWIFSKHTVPELRTKESTPLFIGWPFGNKPTFCDLTINVIYRPAFLCWKKKQTFRFFTATNSEGQIVWYRMAQSEFGAGW
jgi:hypothetical protein